MSKQAPGVIVLTDMFGGTPSNLAISVMESGRVEVIAGMNLPMLIKLSSVRKGDNIAVAIDEAQTAGRKYINVASQLLSEQMSGVLVDRWTMSIARDFLIINQRGLHARASAKFVQVAAKYNASVAVEKDGIKVGGTSIMGLMMLAASPGCSIRVTASGPEAERSWRRSRN